MSEPSTAWAVSPPGSVASGAAQDGNPHTVPEEDGDNLHRHSYAFPSLPSAHGCASAAAMAVLAD